MKVRNWHGWDVSITEAIEIQFQLAARVIKSNEVNTPRFIAGIDISVGNASRNSRGAVVVLSYPGLEVIETAVAEGSLNFPYVPGILSFREAPLAIEACTRLSLAPDLFFVDGQGIAHPRRFGLASHLGLSLDKPTLGCAKSLLCGRYEEPGAGAGSYSEITDNDEIIGVALRTKIGTKPVFVSIGHRIDLSASMYWVTQCCRDYRIPEPLRLAHIAAGGRI